MRKGTAREQTPARQNEWCRHHHRCLTIRMMSCIYFQPWSRGCFYYSERERFIVSLVQPSEKINRQHHNTIAASLQQQYWLERAPQTAVNWWQDSTGLALPRRQDLLTSINSSAGYCTNRLHDCCLCLTGSPTHIVYDITEGKIFSDPIISLHLYCQLYIHPWKSTKTCW